MKETNNIRDGELGYENECNDEIEPDMHVFEGGGRSGMPWAGTAEAWELFRCSYQRLRHCKLFTLRDLCTPQTFPEDGVIIRGDEDNFHETLCPMSLVVHYMNAWLFHFPSIQ